MVGRFWGTAKSSLGIGVGRHGRGHTMRGRMSAFCACLLSHHFRATKTSPGHPTILFPHLFPQWSLGAGFYSLIYSLSGRLGAACGACTPPPDVGGVAVLGLFPHLFRLASPIVAHLCLHACASAMLALLLLCFWGSVSGCGRPVPPRRCCWPHPISGYSANSLLLASA